MRKNATHAKVLPLMAQVIPGRVQILDLLLPYNVTGVPTNNGLKRDIGHHKIASVIKIVSQKRCKCFT